METCGIVGHADLVYGFVQCRRARQEMVDRLENATRRSVEVLMKDGEDARDLVAVVWGQCYVVFSMLYVGLVWAFIRGWQMTLIGVTLVPVCVAVQLRLVAKCEVRNKRANLCLPVVRGNNWKTPWCSNIFPTSTTQRVTAQMCLPPSCLISLLFVSPSPK